ncbi:MAG: tyrosine-protein phosphatase [Alistipes sp.]|nr:tyrosine-protein phosphatase [Candidatus Alistipes equi]
MRIKIHTYVVLVLSLLVFSCNENRIDIPFEPIIEGTVIKIDEYGGLITSFLPKQLEEKGVSYGDMLSIYIGKNIVVDAPYIDAYTQCGSLSSCLCNYNRQDTSLSISIANGSFHYHVGGEIGDKVIVCMKQKEGYLKEYELLKGTYSYSREEYASDEIFANFRKVETSGIKPITLYRSTSPINFKSNRVRFSYTDKLAREAGIKTFIDIADSDEKVKELLAAEENQGSYSQVLFTQNSIIGLGSDLDYITTTFMTKLVRALREIIERDTPVLIHCNEGKDRTGFYFILLEALCGASIDQIKADYMLTFENMYKQIKGSEQYELTWNKNGKRMIYHIAHPELWPKIGEMNFDNISIEGLDLEKVARNYMMLAGLSNNEIDLLKKKIGILVL